ncbi:MAG: Ku protein [Thermoanaerobacterales bacterium]|nr:Ku protein [Bacillota bacterium]MDI6907629.1 Ku protein [Thermoanaerobacterales bacterium]
MRPIWKGALSFGLVYIPVKLYPATEKKEVRFHYLHRECHTPVQYRRWCPVCDTEVPLSDIVRGYEYEKGRYVVIEEQELAAAPADGGRSVSLLDFVDLAEIDPVYYEKSYYLVPAEGGQKAYELLREAMAETGKVAVARVAIRTRESLAVVRVKNRALVMSTMLYPDEVRNPQLLPELDYQVQLHDNERKMAQSLVESLAAPFDPARYPDRRREALLEIIRAKVAGEAVVTPRPAETARVVDLVEALKESIARAKEERKQAAAPKARKAPARKRKEAGA